MKYCSAFLLFVSLPCLLGAQAMESYVFRHLGQENGLAGTPVTNMLQDRQGYLWISCGTDGLQRYDGERYVSFRHNPNDSTSIPFGGAGALFEDSRGTIWCAVGTKHIAVACNPGSRRFRRLSYQGQALSGAYQFFEVRDRVHILTQKGIMRLDAAGNVVETCIESASNYYVIGTQDSTQAIWFWNTQGYHYWDGTSDQLYHAGNNPFHWKIFEEIPQQHGPRALFSDLKGRIWISDWEWDGYCFDPKENTLARYRADRWGAGSVLQFIEDENKRLWAISADRRLCRYVPEADSFICLLSQNENPFAFHSGLSGDEYPVGIRDREGYFWVGNDQGIHIFHPTRQVVHTVRDLPELPFESSLVNDILEAANGDIYASHWHGRLQRFDSDLRKKEIYQNTPRRKFWQTNGIYTVAQDVFGRIWVGEESGWISLLDARGRKLPPLHCAPCKESRIRNIIRARNGDMWINLRKPAIARWQPRTQQFEVFEIPGMSASYPTYSLLEDGSGNIWVGTAGQGLYCFDPVSQKFTTSYYDNTSPESEFSDNEIVALLQLSADTLLIGTEHGLKYLDIKNKVYRRHPLSALFPNPSIYGLLQDPHGNVWFMNGKGIFCADRGLTRLRHFGASEGFAEDNFRLRGFCFLRDGRIAAGTRDGSVVVFYPDSLLQARRTLPAPVITDLEVFGESWMIDSILRRGRPVVLDHTQNAVAVFYGILSYGRPDITYQYRLAGLDNRWTDAGTKREVYFSYLLPGTYNFEVRAAGEDGDLSPVTAFTIIIRPPWWGTWWFYLLFALTLLAIAYAIARDRIRRFRERATYEKRLADLQNQALRAQMNPHFIFNALQSVKKFVLLNDVEQAEHYMSRFARLMRQIMDNSREATVSLRRELDLLDNYLQLEQLRFGHSFDYRFELDPGVQPEEAEVPSMVLQPFVENAVLHGLAHRTGRRGLLLLRCALRDGGLLIEIEDNGVGRARAEELKNPLRRRHHRSAGMEITGRRLALFSGDAKQAARFEIFDLYDEEGKGCGTRVEVWLPEEV